MTEREKVIKAFEFCLMPPSRKEIEDDICSHEDCPYYREYNGGKCISAAASDALALLKAQEPRNAIVVSNGIGVSGGWWFQCPSCKMEIEPIDRYCKSCGQAVKWE